MFRRARATGRATASPPLAFLLVLLAGSTGLAGCDALTRLFRGGPAAGVVDAHVVYRLRPDCTTFLARTLRNGYTVMTPQDDAFQAVETALFEGPVRVGQSIYRYYLPRDTETWSDDWTEVSVDAQAVQLSLPDARAALDAICGPLVEGEPSDDVPRLPDAQ